MKKQRAIFFAFIFGVISLTQAPLARWTQTGGPQGGFIEVMTTDGANIYAGT
jgi:hypothetical protein